MNTEYSSNEYFVVIIISQSFNSGNKAHKTTNIKRKKQRDRKRKTETFYTKIYTETVRSATTKA